MAELIERLHEQRMKAVNAAREIAERGAAGSLSAEDEANYAKANEDIDRFGKMLHDEVRRSNEDKEIADAVGASLRSAGVREHGNNNSDDDEKRNAGREWLIDLRKALQAKDIRSGGNYQALPNPTEVRAARSAGYNSLAEQRAALVTNTAARGPETISPTLVETLFEKVFDDSAVLQAGVTIIRTDSGEELKFPRLASLGALPMSASPTGARVAETGQIGKGEPTFDQISLGAQKYGQISQASREMLEDSFLDVEGLLGRVLGRNMANYLGFDLTLGNGTGTLPRGIIPVAAANTAGQVVSATGVGGAVQNVDQLLDVIYKLKPPYRRNARWLLNDLTTLALRKFKINGEANNYAWQPASRPGEPDTLLGYPMVVDPNIPTAAVGARSIVFADFSNYYVRLVRDVRVEWSTEYAWDTDLVSVKAVLRADGDSVDDTAFASFVGAAT